MVFSSVTFLFKFLPGVLLLYVLAPGRAKNAVLLLASLVFYGWGEPKYVFLMLAAIGQGYVFGRLIGRWQGKRAAKVCLAVSVGLSFAALGYFKYADFLIGNVNMLTGLSIPLLRVALPVGISFYTFQIVSYLVDVYRGDVEAQRNLIDLAAYVAMFPQLIAGPIVRYADVAAQLRVRTHTVSGAAYGARRFVLGLAKKILLANQLGALVEAYKQTADGSVLYSWLYAVAFMLQIYYDFSGYSDMAIGLGKMFGFSFPENFEYPYISVSITEFWRRWHRSLGTWFRDYLYIPLGGNRKGKGRQLFNILIVWLATGLWHGAAWNFVAWGALFAALLVLEKWWLLPVLQRRRWLGHGYVLLAVALGFVLFDAASIKEVLATIGGMFGGGGLALVSAEAVYRLRSFGVVLLIAAVGATPWPGKAFARVEKAKVMTVLEPVGLAALLVGCTAFLVDGSFNPFLYFRF